ncbi:MAG: glycosyltransferase, partial [Clostridium butyricum]|nr:glycosyltransferase [Clostridium butyricum]
IAEDYIKQYKNIFGFDDEIASMEAIINIYSENYENAMDIVRQGLKYNIYSSDLYYTMGNLYEINKKYENAYLCYEQALKFTEKDDISKIIIENLNRLKEQNIKIHNYSIVILTYNQLEYTKVCINSIRKYNSADNCEIIIVDNNSTDGTVEWLKDQEDIKYILNNENRGFPAGCNQGIELSQKDNDIFLLNNDTVVMPNSIFNLRMGLYSDENIGATGAISNSVAYYQQISEKFVDFNGYINFALNNNIPNELIYEKRIKLIGFAMMIKRGVLDKVGLLDERFTPGNFEDDDLSFRIILEGYKLLLCKDSYIHHFGSTSFKEMPEKYNELLKINSKKFREKWGFSSEYSTNIRLDLIGLIKEDSNKPINILEVGCACGASLLSIKNKYPNSSIYGIEINKYSAKIAKCFADIRDENIEGSDLGYEKEFFDYIIFGDVLERLCYPEKVLENIYKYLKPDGYVLASLPNIMYHSVVRDLLNGNWTYEDAGILDKTHLRFFTKNEIIKMFTKTGYLDISIGTINGYICESDKKFIDELSSLSSCNVKEEFSVYQYLIKSQKKQKSDNAILEKCEFLLRRIEFNIDVEETEKEIVKNLINKSFTLNLLLEVISKYIINKVYILNYLAIKCFENNLSDL